MKRTILTILGAALMAGCATSSITVEGPTKATIVAEAPFFFSIKWTVDRVHKALAISCKAFTNKPPKTTNTFDSDVASDALEIAGVESGQANAIAEKIGENATTIQATDDAQTKAIQHAKTILALHGMIPKHVYNWTGPCHPTSKAPT